MFKRLRRREDVLRIVKSGISVRGQNYHLKAEPTEFAQEAAFAVVVGKKTAKNAATRNRIKRRSREALRKVCADFSGFAVVAMPTKKAEKEPFSLLADELKTHAKRLIHRHKTHNDISKNHIP
ncbi:MAG: ribonuclease P protein component [bacterium]|nr:ribonuclease P protein component [bacterium]